MSDEKLVDLDKVATARTPKQLLAIFHQHKRSLDSEFEQEADELVWQMAGRWRPTTDRRQECRFAVLHDQEGKRWPHIVSRLGKSQEYHLFKADCSFPQFSFPLHTTKNMWVVAAFDPTGTFLNAMFVGSFADAAHTFATCTWPQLQQSYAEYINALDPAMLTKLRTSLQQAMLAEEDEANTAHQQHIASIRGRYRNQLNYFTSLLDDAQALKDVKEKATYTLELDGYPPSKPYHSYKDVRRAHSKRNVPHIKCVILRQAHKQPQTTFARWSTTDRIWAIL